MHGGMKTYRGSAAAARHYMEADRGRPDDYYLAEGNGIAERYAASPTTGVRRLEPLTGNTYEAWVAGFDPATGSPKGRLRNDDQAVRFVEVVVNGPKSWSLAAELHPDISRAYDAAQDRAATQIIGWLAQHATTRVGPRGEQLQVPVAEIEAVTVRHHTSRAGDPHRHLHLQVNARVFAEGHWRGLHTVGVRDSLDAINGIGHAAVMTDPEFRRALAAHGFTVDEAGEVVQLSEFVGQFSARAAQIGRNIDVYEADWRTANPGREPSTQQQRAWDARAWADARPDKIVPRDGTELNRRWVDELHALGYRDTHRSAQPEAMSVGKLDRNQAVDEVSSRLGARRSGWNAADIRGEVEQLIARRNVVTDAAIRDELAEDLTARTIAQCVPLTDRPDVPEHIRALTSRQVLAVEADLTTRLIARAETASTEPTPLAGSHYEVDGALDLTQRDVVAALAGERQLVVVEGAAGAGKTTTLAATRTALDLQGRRLLAVTPTLKAARVAVRELGTNAFSAAWLAHQHGYRWDDNGAWTRLARGQTDPLTGRVYACPSDAATLRTGDLLLVDEAGMLDQDTARALLTIADEQHARVALVGDRHQLPAVGRGGVLDLAARWVDPDARLTLDTVHRFIRTCTDADGTATTVPDEQFAQLSLAMRCGTNPDGVFDTLLQRDQIRVHACEQDRIAALADAATATSATATPTVVLADTREQVAALNDAIRIRLVRAGVVDDEHPTTTAGGQRIGAGDRVATRRNDVNLGVANRETWTVTDVTEDGHVTVTGERGERSLPAAYVREYVELAYATTVHGVQGDTTTQAHLAVGEHTTAASAYVGMTRGRETNIAHLVADTVDDARENWVAVFGRDRADLGPAHAADLAEREAVRYAQLRPLDTVLGELRRAWTLEEDCQQRLADAEQRRELLVDVVALTAQRDQTVPVLKQTYHVARISAEQAAVRANQLDAEVSTRTADIAANLQREWEQQRPVAWQAAQIVRDGPGRLGQRRSALKHAGEDLVHWSATWQPYLSTMPNRLEAVVGFAHWFDDTPLIRGCLDQYARKAAEQARPDYVQARASADDATRQRDDALRAFTRADSHYRIALAYYGTLDRVADPTSYLDDLEHTIDSTRAQLTSVQTSLATLHAEPTLRTQPVERIMVERDQWQADRDARSRERSVWQPETESAVPSHERSWGGAVPEISHDGPSRGFGR
jgi:exodeoxyribonuclease V alpha subunit